MMEDDVQGGAADGIVGEFDTYEDYLDSQVRSADGSAGSISTA